ncbi:hypothetical protein ACLK19_27100 [Escherichia coli]
MIPWQQSGARSHSRGVPYYYAIRNGMDMGIVNAGQLAISDNLPAELRNAVEDVILNRRDNGAERSGELPEKYRGSKTEQHR